MALAAKSSKGSPHMCLYAFLTPFCWGGDHYRCRNFIQKKKRRKNVHKMYICCVASLFMRSFPFIFGCKKLVADYLHLVFFYLSIILLLALLLILLSVF